MSARSASAVCAAPPDFVVEVLSPETTGHDQVKKRRIYERHGVREYWLVHPTDQVLTVYRLMGTEYGKPDVQELTGETPIGVFFGRHQRARGPAAPS